jgi:hypothetical protein
MAKKRSVMRTRKAPGEIEENMRKTSPLRGHGFVNTWGMKMGETGDDDTDRPMN